MATLKDVARIAQVSPITVSRVINTPEKVKPATRERVRRVMSSLQYIPNVAAKNLVTKRSGIIDVFVPESIDLSDPFVMQFIAGVSNVLSRRMYSFLILRDRTREHFCDGYIVTGLLKNEILEFQEYGPGVLGRWCCLATPNCRRWTASTWTMSPARKSWWTG